MAVLRGDDESLAPRARALARLAVTLTAQPWALTEQTVGDVRRQGLDEEQIEAAVGVISLFNYYTRVADATGIEFDYPTELPAFEPDVCRVAAPRPDRPVVSGRRAEGRRRPRHERWQAAWESWRAYVLEADEPIGQRERRLLAAVAAEEAADWEGADELNGVKSGSDDDDQLIRFARKLSRQPWLMEEAGLGIIQLLPPFPGVPWGRHVRSQQAMRHGRPLPRSVMPKILAGLICLMAAVSAVVVLASALR